MNKFVTTMTLLLNFSLTGLSQVSVNTSSMPPHTSAMLDISSSNKGLLIPRIALTSITDVATIPGAINSLLIYNTANVGSGTNAITPGYYYYDSGIWKRLAVRSEIDQVVPGTIIMLETPTTPAGYSLVGRITLQNAIENYAGVATGTYASIPVATDVRQKHSAIWNGSLMAIWGGRSLNMIGTTLLNTGEQFNPATNSWSAMNATGLIPSAREYHSTIYNPNFNEMVIWGGSTSTSSTPAPTNTGAYYSFIANTWNFATPAAGAPAARYNHSSVRNGNIMYVWGGRDAGGIDLSDGGVLDMNPNIWLAAMAAPPAAITARSNHIACWTGSKMIIWGGQNGFTQLTNGGLYDPATNTWTEIPSPSFYASSNGSTGQWTGTQFVILGPFMNARYNPATNTWQQAAALPSGVTTAPDYNAASVWTGTEMITCGGDSGPEASNLNIGYNPSTDQWVLHPNMPVRRVSHSAVWTGTEMISFGGNPSSPGNVLATKTGERFNPSVGSSQLYLSPTNAQYYVYRKN